MDCEYCEVDAFRAGPILPVKVGTICCKVKTTTSTITVLKSKLIMPLRLLFWTNTSVLKLLSSSDYYNYANQI